MGVFEMVVLIVLIACISGVIRAYMKGKSNQAPQINEDLIAQINDLEERIRVLERVVTDDKSALSNEIHSLGK